MVKALLFIVGIALLTKMSTCLDFAGDIGLGGGASAPWPTTHFDHEIKGDTLIVDDCDPMDPNSCGPGKCCVKEGMMYIPELTGPKPAYRQSCQDLAGDGHFCMASRTTEMCPCATGLTCKTTLGSFGHCHH